MVLLDGLIASTAPEALVPQARRLRQVVLVHMPLGHRPPDDEAGAVRAREREVLAAAAAVVTTSAWTRRRLGELYALPADRVHVTEPGVDAACLAPGTAAGDALLCVAALTPDKGHDVLLDALATATDLSWRCACVGSLVRDPAFADGVRRRARDSGLGDRVRFPGPLTGAELDRAYAAADLLVLASHAETYGMVVTEALARGLPVLATEVGGVTEALGQGEDGTRPGLLVPPGDPAALGAALRTWLGDAELRARLRRAARERRASLRRWHATDLERPRRAPARKFSRERRDECGGRPGQPGVAPPARAGRRGGALGRARRAPRAAPRHGRPPRDPRPRRRQRRDGPLAGAAAARAAALGGARPGRRPAEARRRRRSGPGRRHVEARRSDITRLTPRDLASASLITASALLDLLTADGLVRMLRACAGRPMLLTLTVVGRVTLSPADPLDARIGTAFNAHQRRGGLLGPDAVAAAVEELRAEVLVRPSPWRLDGAHADLAAEWVDGWVAAACEQEPALAAEAGAYRERRLAQAAAGELAVTVDHADLLVLP